MHSTASARGADLFAKRPKPHVRASLGQRILDALRHVFTLDSEAGADLLTADRCIDGFPALGVFHYINQRLGRLIVAEESGLRGC